MLELREISDPVYKDTIAAWELSMPRWWKIADAAIAKFVVHGPKVAIGVFHGDDLAAVFYVQQIDSHTAEGHLSCPKGTDPRLIEDAGRALKARLFAQGFTRIVVELPALNRGLLQIVKAWGFTPTNATITAGEINSRPIRWIQLEALSNVQ